MRKKSWVLMLMVLLLGGNLVYAQEMKADEMGAHKKKMGGKMGGMCPTMKSMMERSVVATSDGGVIVIMGNKLTKYDKDLNVVKEVDLKMDPEGMKKMMGEMKGMCPMMGKGMMEGSHQEAEGEMGAIAPEDARPAQGEPAGQQK
jgi:hypothetical protein